MIKLPPPPKREAAAAEWEQWYMNLWKYVQGSIVTSSGTATVGIAETYHGVTGTGGGTITLPDAATLKDGDEIVIQDEGGNAGSSNITIARSGSDTINGGASVAISSNYGRRVIIKRGAGKFFSA
jgi:hypothetical protein